MDTVRSRKQQIWNVFFLVLYLGLAFVLYKFYIRELIKYPGPLGNYDSDLPAHFNEGISGSGYSLVELGFWFIVHVLHLGHRASVLFIIAMTLGTIYLTAVLMKKIMPQCDGNVLHLLSFVCVFVMPFYLPKLNHFRYLGVQCGSVWHNSTYVGMRFAAMLVMIYWAGLQDTYMDKFGMKEFVILTALLSFVNLMKPNFIVAFAPAMALIVLGDCFKTKGKYFGRQCVLALSVIISLVILVYEVTKLFPSSGSSSGSEGFPIGFSIAYVLRLRAAHPVISILQSAAFPLTVLLANLKDLKSSRFFRLTWLTWLIGLCEFLFIHENGYRKDDGNLSWGYSFCIYLVFAVSLAWFCRDLHQIRTEYVRERDGSLIAWLWKKDRFRCVYLIIASVFLAWHLACGLKYFVLICLGASYTI